MIRRTQLDDTRISIWLRWRWITIKETFTKECLLQSGYCCKPGLLDPLSRFLLYRPDIGSAASSSLDLRPTISTENLIKEFSIFPMIFYVYRTWYAFDRIVSVSGNSSMRVVRLIS